MLVASQAALRVLLGLRLGRSLSVVVVRRLDSKPSGGLDCSSPFNSYSLRIITRSPYPSSIIHDERKSGFATLPATSPRAGKTAGQRLLCRLQSPQPTMGFTQSGHLRLHELCRHSSKDGDPRFQDQVIDARRVEQGAGREDEGDGQCQEQCLLQSR